VAIVVASQRLLDDELFYRSAAVPRRLFGDGHAAERIVDILRGLGASEFVAQGPRGTVQDRESGVFRSDRLVGAEFSA